jgi:serine/threonine-protein kinase
VFRAYDATRERLVAVKLFKLDLPPERSHQLVAELEGLIAAGLTHPAIATPLSTGISGVSAFLAQDYVAADSLDLAVREYGHAPAGNVLRVAIQLAGALDHAASRNIEHGALHPRDVLLASDDTRLTGLGITRALARIGVVAPVRRPYTPPERIGGGEWDRRADVFSLAAVIHELMWGRRLSGLGAQAAASLTAIPGGNLEALQNVFARALAENPGERFETALAFVTALEQACPDIAIAPDPPRPSRRRMAREDIEPRLPLDGAPAAHEAEAAHVPPFPVEVDVEDVPPAVAIADLESTYRSESELEALREAQADGQPVHESLVHDSPVQESQVDEPLVHEPPVAVPAGVITGNGADTFSPLERTRSAVWPLVLALGVGIGIGFAGGFFTGSREQAPAAPVAAPAAAAPPVREFTVPQPAAREFTESAVPTPSTAPPTSAASAAPPNAEPAEPVGRVLVRTLPAGAHVLVDGKDYGPSPAAVRELAPGTHRVRITQIGYLTEERRVVITPSRPARSMTVTLARASAAAPPQAPVGSAGHFTGGLMVESRPAGANVFVDNHMVGTTPVSLKDVTAGSHAIRLEHDGYRRWSASVRIVASEQNRVTASLER